MIPIVIASGAKKIISNKKVQTVLVILILALVFRRTIRKLIRKWRERKFDANEGKNVNQLAQQYRSASNPSGVSWMINFDGTDENEIEKLGYQTKEKLQDVANAYKLKFDESLSDRIRKELSPSDFQNWRNIVT